MSWIDDFWNNITGGATTIATAPDPITNIATSEPTPTPNPQNETTKMYKVYGEILPLTPVAVNYYISKGIHPIPVNNEPANSSFETLYPKQTQQLNKMGVDMTDLGDIVTRQDVTDISHQEQINQAHEHRQILETRSQKAIDERADIHAKLAALGQHKHDEENNNGMDWYVKLGIVAVIGFIVYFILRKALFK